MIAALRQLFEASRRGLEAERQRQGFSIIGSTEADARTPGGPSLIWGRGATGGFWLLEPGSSTWRETTLEDAHEAWPHAQLPRSFG